MSQAGYLDRANGEAGRAVNERPITAQNELLRNVRRAEDRVLDRRGESTIRLMLIHVNRKRDGNPARLDQLRKIIVVAQFVLIDAFLAEDQVEDDRASTASAGVLGENPPELPWPGPAELAAAV